MNRIGSFFGVNQNIPESWSVAFGVKNEEVQGQGFALCKSSL